MPHKTKPTISGWLDQTIAEFADDKAITFLRAGRVETELTYAQLDGEISVYEKLIGDLGVGQGDRVILFFPKSLNAVMAYLALQRIGAVAVPLNPGFKASEMSYLLEDAQSRLVLCDAGRGDWLKEIDQNVNLLEFSTHIPYIFQFNNSAKQKPAKNFEIDSQDPGLIIYTSGTTGKPKGAILTQGNLVHDATNVISIWEIRAGDVLCHALPLFHVHGLCFGLHTALLSGAHVVMLDAFDPAVALDVLSNKLDGYICTVFMAVPAMYAKIMDQIKTKSPETKYDFTHIRLLTSGSAPLLPQEFDRIRNLLGQEPVEREGMSETGMNFSNPLHGRRVPGSIGLPLPGLEVRIVDPQSCRDVDEGEVGELWLRSPSITPGYWRKPKETRETFREEWFRTGDLGRRDGEGYYYLTDRIKHIIITGGENVSAKEVESVINGIDGIIESAVVGVPDAKWGERVVAAVVKKPDVDIGGEQIRTHCKVHLHDWKCPKEIRFVNELPRNTMGKVLVDAVKGLFI